MLVLGLVVTALTFYSSLAINGPQSEWHDSKVAAVCFLACVALPYILFLWWITIGRVFVQRKVRGGGDDESKIITCVARMLVSSQQWESDRTS